MATIQVGSWKEESDPRAVRAARDKLRIDPSLAISQLERLAESGSVKGMLYLADAYMRGRGAPKDFEKARYWYQRIGERDVIFGAHMAASMDFRLKKFEEARLGFWRCAEVGFLPSMYRKGYMLSVGLGGNKDLEQAEAVLRDAMNRGHFGAALYYARLMTRGVFGIKNIPRGIYMSIASRVRFVAAVLRSGGALVSQWDDRYVL